MTEIKFRTWKKSNIIWRNKEEKEEGNEEGNKEEKEEGNEEGNKEEIDKRN